MTASDYNRFSDYMDALNLAMNIQGDVSNTLRVWGDFYPLFAQNKKYLASEKKMDHQRIGIALSRGNFYVQYADPDFNSLIAEDALFFLYSDYSSGNPFGLTHIYNLFYYHPNYLLDQLVKIRYHITENMLTTAILMQINGDLMRDRHFERGRYVTSLKDEIIALTIRWHLIQQLCAIDDGQVVFIDSIFDRALDIDLIRKDISVINRFSEKLARLDIDKSKGENWLRTLYFQINRAIREN